MSIIAFLLVCVAALRESDLDHWAGGSHISGWTLAMSHQKAFPLIWLLWRIMQPEKGWQGVQSLPWSTTGIFSGSPLQGRPRSFPAKRSRKMG